MAPRSQRGLLAGAWAHFTASTANNTNRQEGPAGGGGGGGSWRTGRDREVPEPPSAGTPLSPANQRVIVEPRNAGRSGGPVPPRAHSESRAGLERHTCTAELEQKLHRPRYDQFQPTRTTRNDHMGKLLYSLIYYTDMRMMIISYRYEDDNLIIILLCGWGMNYPDKQSPKWAVVFILAMITNNL